MLTKTRHYMIELFAGNPTIREGRRIKVNTGFNLKKEKSLLHLC